MEAADRDNLLPLRVSRSRKRQIWSDLMRGGRNVAVVERATGGWVEVGCAHSARLLERASCQQRQSGEDDRQSGADSAWSGPSNGFVQNQPFPRPLDQLLEVVIQAARIQKFSHVLKSP